MAIFVLSRVTDRLSRCFRHAIRHWQFFRTPIPLIIHACLQALENGGGYCVPGWR